MAGTEDISEQVGNLLLTHGAKIGVGILERAGDLTKAATEDSKKFFVDVSNARQKSNAQNQLDEREQYGDNMKLVEFNAMASKLELPTDAMNIADIDAKDFEAELRRARLVFASMDNTKDDYTVFVFFQKDAEKVEAAYQTLMAQRGKISELPPQMFQNLPMDKLTVLDNVDDVHVELFRNFAKEHNLLFTHIPATPEHGNQILYHKKDNATAHKVMMSVGWALTGADGARVREQVSHYIKGRTRINDALDAHKEMYIIAKQNPNTAVHITSTEMELYKNGNLVLTLDRAAPDFHAKCWQYCNSLPHAVVLTGEEFRQAGMTPDVIRQMPTMDLFPQDTVEITEAGINNMHDGYDPVREQARINSLSNLVSEKYAFDNEGNSNWAAFDSSVSLSEFASHEYYHDVEEREAREAEFERFKEAKLHSYEAFSPEEVDMADRSLDYVISRAYQRAGTQPPEQNTPEHTSVREVGERGGDDR